MCGISSEVLGNSGPARISFRVERPVVNEPLCSMEFGAPAADTAGMSEQAVGRMLWAVMFAVLVGSILTFAASRLAH
jgi:hypothetical protein